MKQNIAGYVRFERNVHLFFKVISSLSRRTVALISLILSAAYLVYLSLTTPSQTTTNRWAEYGADLLRRRSELERKYSHVLVKDCMRRLPSGGKTTDTKVRGIGVNYVSWAKNPEDAIFNLRAYPPVRAMSKFRRPATLLDIGANIGKITLPVMGLFEPHTVISIEPVSKNMDALCMGANLNGWMGHPNLILVEAAMSDNDGSLQIFVPDGREDNAALSSDASVANLNGIGQHAETIQTISGDEFLRTGKFTPDVIKIDVQGHELHVLKGLKNYLKSAQRTLVIAESDPKLMKKSGVDPKDVFDLMVKELGYTAFYHVDVSVKNGVLHADGDVMEEDVYPTRTVRDIYYFKKQL